MKSKYVVAAGGDNDAEPLRYVLYARKSSEDVGAQAKSLPDQIKDSLNYAESKGIVVVETLKESHSAKISGRRPIFTKMLKDLEAGKYDGVLAWHPDRLARNSLEAGTIVDMVDNGKIKDLKFPTLEFTNDSNGKLLLNIMFAMSKQYSEHLSESVQRGVNSNLEQGKSGGIPKWGYNRSEVTGLYEPDENFEHIKHVFDMYLDGHSQQDIIKYLRDHDVHRKTKISRKNKVVRKVKSYGSTATVGKILGDPFYYGILVQSGQQVDLRVITPNFKPLITEDEFNRVQARRRGLKKVVSASVKAEDDKVFIPFRQFVKCGVCGNFMHVSRASSHNKTDKYLYFRCGNRECTRDKKNIRSREVLASIYETIDSLKITPKKINAAKAELTDYINNRHNEYITEKLSINAAIKAKKRELDTLSQAYIDLGKDAPKEAKTLLKNQIEECRIIISDLQIDLKAVEEKIFDPDQVQEILEELTNQLNSLQFKIRTADAWQKDQIARNLFTNLEINNKNEVSYRCKRPLQGIIFGDSKHQIHFGAPD